MKMRLALAITVAMILTLPAFSKTLSGEQEHPGEAQHSNEAQRGGEQQHPGEPHGEPQHQGEPAHGAGEMQHPSQVPHGPPRANQGRIPAPPVKREPAARPAPDTRGGHTSNIPHVADNRWYGHDRPNDSHYHLPHPFEHGRFAHFGPTYRYNVVRIDPRLHEFWLPGGYYFQVPAWDWALAEDWCWNCGEDFVVYEDPDHPGWYLLYNIHTGAYVHVLYMGG